ncbi:hypothetical protein SAMN05444722_1683 [Rhodovulum sp. ES.010]|uniref:hypothetical protein n=1 Tax=Rhodovulum sp. ES.010 TaxID=1882821 RepID=UPI00092BB1D4|nr:hypothetical protein [Rhodovulum sp. ES.010]SIO36391.1 hypothetical protein SAMN05444722_1683 [Rhodovulum sp. ES.010]
MAFPPAAVKIAALRREQVVSALRTRSPYSFASTAYDFMGGMWRAELELVHVERADNAAIEAWLASLGGPAGTFELREPDYDGPYGTVSANPSVAVAATARAQTLRLQMQSGEAAAAGDLLTLGGHLHVVTSAGAPDGGGVQAVTVWPRLRADAGVGAAVEMLAPYGTWALAGPANGYAVSQSRVRTRTLQIVEAI